jgi:hypothetical protein
VRECPVLVVHHTICHTIGHTVCCFRHTQAIHKPHCCTHVVITLTSGCGSFLLHWQGHSCQVGRRGGQGRHGTAWVQGTGRVCFLRCTPMPAPWVRTLVVDGEHVAGLRQAAVCKGWSSVCAHVLGGCVGWGAQWAAGATATAHGCSGVAQQPTLPPNRPFLIHMHGLHVCACVLPVVNACPVALGVTQPPVQVCGMWCVPSLHAPGVGSPPPVWLDPPGCWTHGLLLVVIVCVPL